jgi:hypothetical protein
MRSVPVSAAEEHHSGKCLAPFALIFAMTLPLRSAASGKIASGIRKGELAFLGVSLPAYRWQSARLRRGTPGNAMRQTMLLFVNTAMALRLTAHAMHDRAGSTLL